MFWKKLFSKKTSSAEKQKETKHLKERREVKKTTKKKKIKIKEEKTKKLTGTSSRPSVSDWLKPEGEPLVDIYQTEDEFCIVSPIAGITAENLEITIEEGILFLKGEREEPEKEKRKNYFLKECYWGPFAKKIALPEDVDIERIKAVLNRGVLSVKIPRIKKEKNQRIIIEEE